MEKCNKCFMLKATEKSKCLCSVKPFNEKKLFKDKAIKPISEKKEERIKESGSEIQLFKKVFLNLKKKGKNKCLICQKTLNEDDINPSCFAHILPKGKYAEFRYFENNIGLVCGIEHHHQFDVIINEIKKKVGGFDFEQLIRDGKYIDITSYLNNIN